MHCAPFLAFDGDGREAMTWYAELFGAPAPTFMSYADAPPGVMPGMDADKVMYRDIRDGEALLAGADPMPSRHREAQGMTVMVDPPDGAEGRRIFDALAQGGEVRCRPRRPSGPRASGWCATASGRPGSSRVSPPRADRGLRAPPGSARPFLSPRGAAMIRPTTRIDDTFERLRAEGRRAFVTYVMAGDPDAETTLAVLRGLPGAGADVIELGLPFTDPMADGPTIQRAGQRALASGTTLAGTLDLVRRFREGDGATPVVLMGYYNPIHAMGVDRFLRAASDAGVDGLIVVDLPPEEDAELCLPARAAGIDFIRLATPTTDAARLPRVLENTSGFVYYVSIAGITGAGAADAARVAPEVARIKASTDLPVVVGFGIRTPEAARGIAAVADGAVVGSAIVDLIGQGRPVPEVLAFVATLAAGAHAA